MRIKDIESQAAKYEYGKKCSDEFQKTMDSMQTDKQRTDAIDCIKKCSKIRKKAKKHHNRFQKNVVFRNNKN